MRKLPLLSKKAAATLVVFSVFAASGFAQAPSAEKAREISSLSSVSAPGDVYSDMSAKLVANPQDNSAASALAPQVKMSEALFKARAYQVLNRLAIHLDASQQRLAMHSILTAMFVSVDSAKEMLEKLPVDNAVRDYLHSSYSLSQALGVSKINWTSLSKDILDSMPQVNIQTLSKSSGVQSLKQVLDKGCGQISTSVAIDKANIGCANSMSARSLKAARYLQDERIRDGYLAGEFNGIPVFVSLTGALADNVANVRLIKDTNEPLISISASLAEHIAKTGNMDVYRLILAHESGHVHEHQHKGVTPDYNSSEAQQIKYEVDADKHAIETMQKMGISADKTARAFNDLQSVFKEMFGEQALNEPALKNMMQARQVQFENSHAVQNIGISM